MFCAHSDRLLAFSDAHALPLAIVAKPAKTRTGESIVKHVLTGLKCAAEQDQQDRILPCHPLIGARFGLCALRRTSGLQKSSENCVPMEAMVAFFVLQAFQTQLRRKRPK